MNRKFRNLIAQTKEYIHENPLDATLYGFAIIVGSIAVYQLNKNNEKSETETTLFMSETVGRHMFDTGESYLFETPLGDLILTPVPKVSE